jgi:replicative DNA helicase
MNQTRLECEQAILGGLMLDCHKYEDIEMFLQEDNFELPIHKKIFRAMQHVHIFKKEVFDVVTISDELKKDLPAEEFGQNEVYVFELSRNTPSSSLIRQYTIMLFALYLGELEIDLRKDNAGKKVYGVLDRFEKDALVKEMQQEIQEERDVIEEQQHVIKTLKAKTKENGSDDWVKSIQ